ncbi:MAG: ABC transporter permease [Lachnospiraceae bacterium]|nr:ABC transporter permease [Lachnospiraceae bacterium]
MLNGCRQKKMGVLTSYFLEDYYFQFAMLIGLFAGVFTTLYLSVEYDDGVIRNKIIAGHARTEIYLSNLLLTFLASLFMMGLGLLGGLVGIPTFGMWNISGFKVLFQILIMAMFLLAFCSIFTMLSMLIQNKSTCAIITVLMFFSQFVTSSIMINRLAEPETVSDVLLTAQGIQYSDPMPNPFYVEGKVRQILDFMVDVFPSGQGLRLASNELVHPARMLLLSALVAVFVTLAGIFLFKKKDLK